MPGSLLDRLDRAASELVRAYQWLPAAALYGISLGGGVWALAHRARVGAILHNALTPAEITTAAIWAALATALVGIAYLRALGRAASSAEAAAQLGARFTPALALPILVVLSQRGIEAKSPGITLVLIALAAAAIGRGLHAADVPAVSLPPKAARAVAAISVGALWMAYGLFFSRLSIINHHARGTGTADLGYYVNVFYHSSHGRPLASSYFLNGSHSAAHFDPILVLLSPLYALYPRAELLLILQSFWLGAGVVPIYLLARSRDLPRVPSFALALAYALYPALHGANLYDFHSLSLLTPLALWLLYFAERGNVRAYAVTLVLALACREDVALVLCPVGLCLLLDARPGKARLGWTTIAAGVIAFIVVKRSFMASSEVLNTGPVSRSYERYYADLIPHGGGVTGLVLSLLGNPSFAALHALAAPKLEFLALLFVPLAFLPVLARPERGMLVYGVLFSILGSHAPLFVIHYQYTTLITPFAFAATIAALSAVAAGRALPSADGPRLARALALTVAACTALTTYKFGGLVANESMKAGARTLTRVLDEKHAADYAWIEATAASIPESASVAVTDTLGAHVSGRPQAYFYHERDKVDYVFVDEEELRGELRNEHAARVAAGKLVEVARRGSMVLYRAMRR